MLWDIKVAKRIYKEMKKFPVKDTSQILEVLEFLPKNPYTGDIEKLSGETNIWRRRVGAYRLTYELYPQSQFIAVLDVCRRTTTTYKKRK